MSATTTPPSISGLLTQLQTRIASVRTKITSTTGGKLSGGLGLNLGSGTLAKNIGTGTNVTTIQTALKTKLASLRGSTTTGGLLGTGGILAKLKAGTGPFGLQAPAFGQQFQMPQEMSPQLVPPTVTSKRANSGFAVRVG